MNDRSLEPFFLHADGDSFFVACELSRMPELIGKPVVVGEDRGIAVAMSREAKALGVTRGMPTFQIKKLFPEVIILPHHFSLYRTISNGVRDILLSYLESVEEYSIDECFAIVKPSDIRFFGSERELAQAIQNEIHAKFGVSYSFGMARTKALAKTASKLKKPNGCVVLLTDTDEAEVLKATPIDDVWGLGRRTVPRLAALGMKSAYDFIRYDSKILARHFSEPVLLLQEELSGRSIYQVHTDVDPREQKSIQSTGTFRPTSSDPGIIWAELAENAEAACQHARKLRLLTKSISFFVKTKEFRYRFTDAHLPLYTADPGMLLNAMEKKFSKLLVNGEKIRSTGVTLSNLRREEDVPRDLFGSQEGAIASLAVEEMADKVRAKFGRESIKRASSLRGSGKEIDSSLY